MDAPAWACVIAEPGYPAMRLFRWFRIHMSTNRAAMASSASIGLAASITVGFYEHLAYRANWWKYEKTRLMLGDFCALYIPFGEFMMFLAIIPVAARMLTDGRHRTASLIEGGAAFALTIAQGYVLAYLNLKVL